mgnify:CR=1 FL=1
MGRLLELWDSLHYWNIPRTICLFKGCDESLAGPGYNMPDDVNYWGCKRCRAMMGRNPENTPCGIIGSGEFSWRELYDIWFGKPWADNG